MTAMRAALALGATQEARSALLDDALLYVARNPCAKSDVLKMLVSMGANIDSVGISLMTPLHLAARNAQPAMVELLLQQGAEPNTVNSSGNSPLFSCVEHFYCMRTWSLWDDGTAGTAADDAVATILLLSDYGAYVNARNHKGETVLDSTERCGEWRLSESLRRIRQCLLSLDGRNAKRLVVLLDDRLPLPTTPTQTRARM